MNESAEENSRKKERERASGEAMLCEIVIKLGHILSLSRTDCSTNTYIISGRSWAGLQTIHRLSDISRRYRVREARLHMALNDLDDPERTPAT